MPPSNSHARREAALYDTQLVNAARAGDSRAFRTLVERYEKRAFAIAFSLVREENDARDVVQEAFLRVHRSLSSFTGNSSFFTWFYRILTNLCIDLRRKPEARASENEALDAWDAAAAAGDDGSHFLAAFGAPERSPLDILHQRELGEKLSAALDTLSVHHRSVILLREVEGMSYEEIAEVMGISKGTVMSRLFHARQRLQRALLETYYELRPAPATGSSGRTRR